MNEAFSVSKAYEICINGSFGSYGLQCTEDEAMARIDEVVLGLKPYLVVIYWESGYDIYACDKAEFVDLLGSRMNAAYDEAFELSAYKVLEEPHHMFNPLKYNVKIDVEVF